MKLSIKGLRFLVCLVIALFGVLYGSQAGFYYLGFSDEYTLNINALVVVFIQSIFFTWYRSFGDVEAMILKYVKVPTPYFYKIMNKFWIPVVCGFLAVHALFE
jgi:SNF family Na+-dependent transporter